MEPPIGHDQNADQIAYWNGPGGQHWRDRQQTQDILLAPVADLLIDRDWVRPRSRGRQMASRTTVAVTRRSVTAPAGPRRENRVVASAAPNWIDPIAPRTSAGEGIRERSGSRGVASAACALSTARS